MGNISLHINDKLGESRRREEKSNLVLYKRNTSSFYFKLNFRFVRSFNRQSQHFKLKLNAFADMTEDEYNMHKGDKSGGEEEGADDEKEQKEDDDDENKKDENRAVERNKRSSHSKNSVIHENYKPRRHSPEIPEQLDWRKYGKNKEYYHFVIS